MTVENRASRWVARWFMRISGAGEILRIIYFGGIFLTTGVSALQQTGNGQYSWLFVIITALGTLAFAYVYTEVGIWNQQQRDRRDQSTNFAAPDMRIDDELISRGVTAGQFGRPLTDEERDAITEELDCAWADLRKGVPIIEDPNQ